MRRVALVTGLCALAAAGSAGAAGESGGARASLHVVDLQPLVVGGTAFQPGERVQLMLSTGEGQVWRAKIAGVGGSLTARFGVSVGACRRFSVHAFGSRGSRARLMTAHALLDCITPDRTDPTDRIGLTT